MKKRLAAIMLAALVMSAICACGGGGGAADPKEPFVGKWANASGNAVYEFKADGTGSFTVSESAVTEFTFEVTDNKIKLTYTSAAEPSEFEFKIEGDVLTIQDSYGNGVEYTKQ